MALPLQTPPCAELLKVSLETRTQGQTSHTDLAYDSENRHAIAVRVATHGMFFRGSVHFHIVVSTRRESTFHVSSFPM